MHDEHFACHLNQADNYNNKDNNNTEDDNGV